MDASTMKAIEDSSNLPSTPEAAQPAADVKPKIMIKPKVKAKPVAHKVKKVEEEAPKKPAHKVAHKKKKDDDLPPEIKVRDDSLNVKVLKVEPHIERDDDPPAETANAAIGEQTPTAEELPADPEADAKANEIIEQIKSASAGIKNADGSSSDDQVKGLESLLDTAGALIQLTQDIKIDPESELAFDYLEH